MNRIIKKDAKWIKNTEQMYQEIEDQEWDTIDNRTTI